MTTIVRASPAHAAVMAAIHASAFPPRDAWGRDAFALQLELPGCFGLLDAAGGAVLARVAADEAEILTLAVDPAARRRGVGRALLGAALAVAADSGATGCFLEVSAANAPARALYAGAGFRQAGVRRNYYSDNSDALVLRLDLAADAAATCPGAAAVR
jgi:ribosomal-protein-alanine N-acetyltransferase